MVILSGSPYMFELLYAVSHISLKGPPCGVCNNVPVDGLWIANAGCQTEGIWDLG